MPFDEDEINLQPIHPHIVEHERSWVKSRIQRATAQLEFERICSDAEKGADLRLAAFGWRFGIRHIIVTTALSAFVITLSQAWGRTGGVVGLLLAVLIGGWLLVRDREHHHARQIARRLRKFNRRNPSRP